MTHLTNGEIREECVRNDDEKKGFLAVSSACCSHVGNKKKIREMTKDDVWGNGGIEHACRGGGGGKGYVWKTVGGEGA